MYARWIETHIMVSLAGQVVENRFLDTLTTGPSSDLVSATGNAVLYVGRFAMGPTKMILPVAPNQPPPGPVMVAAHEMLDELYEETERLLREKEPALHHLAKALIERDELIGDELEAVFAEVEAANPELLDTFQRKIIQFRNFAPMPREDPNAWTPPAPSEQEAADEEPAAKDGPGDWTPGRHTSGRRRGMPPDAIPPWARV